MTGFDKYQVQKLVDLIAFYRERGWNPGTVLEFLILNYARQLK